MVSHSHLSFSHSPRLRIQNSWVLATEKQVFGIYRRCLLPIMCSYNPCVKGFSGTIGNHLPFGMRFYRSLLAFIQNQRQLWKQTPFKHRKKSRLSKCWGTLKKKKSTCIYFLVFPFFPDLRFPPDWPSCVGAKFHTWFHGSEGQIAAPIRVLADWWSLCSSLCSVVGIVF